MRLSDRTARATEVTSGDVVTYTCDEGTTDGGVFDGDTYILLNSLVRGGGPFSSVSTRSELTFPFVALVGDATTGVSSGNCHHLREAVTAGWRIVLT